MFEINTDGSEKQETEKWYISQILDAIETDDLEEVLKALQHAWASHFVITSSEIEINNLEETSISGIGMTLVEFFQKKIKEGRISPEERIKYYKKILPYDSILAYSFIERIVPTEDEEDEFDDFKLSLINPEELYVPQMEYYLWLVERGDVLMLEAALDNDGHLDNTAQYKIDENTKRKIITCAQYIIDLQNVSPNSLNLRCARRILKAFGKSGEFEGKANI